MLQYFWLIVCLFGQGLLALMLGAALTLGVIPGGGGVWVWASGLALAMAAAVTLGLGRAIAGRVCLHGTLLLGAVVFALPFIWLVSTSFKYPEETFVYPPRWLPATPEPVSASPYLATDRATEIDRQDKATREHQALHETAWQAVRGHLPAASSAFEPAALREAILPAVLARARAMRPGGDPDEPVNSAEATLVAELPPTVLAAVVRERWRAVYRGLHLGPVTVYDRARRATRLASPKGASDGWQSASSGVTFRVLPPGPADAASSTVVSYQWGHSEVLTLTRALPLALDPKDLHSVSLPMRQDRSWHRYRVTLDLDGRRYATRDTLALGDRGTRELTFKLHHLDPRDERDMGVWPLYDTGPAGPDSATPGRARLSLELLPVSPLMAAYYKYTQSYRDAWYAEPMWPRFLFNSALLVVLNVVGQIVACSLAAFAFSRLTWPGRDWVFGVVLATMMLPSTVMLIPQFLIFKQLGWYNTLLPLWVPAFTGTPFFIFLLRQFMLGLPRELDESARLDGASWFTIYRLITLPLMRPALAAVGIFTFMNTWNEFMGPLIFLSDERLYPLSLGLYNFRTEHGGDFNVLMAASTLMVLPVIGVFFIAQRYFIEGVTLTGLKG